MSIRDWEKIQKIQQKLEKVLILCIICWNFEKELEWYSEKLGGNFENLSKSF